MQFSRRFSLTLLAMTLLLSGCAGSVKGGTFKLSVRQVSITSEPVGAEVIQLHPFNRAPSSLGRTPLTDVSVTVMTDCAFKQMSYEQAQMILKHQDHLVVVIKKAGYTDFTGAFKTDAGEPSTHSVELLPVE